MGATLTFTTVAEGGDRTGTEDLNSGNLYIVHGRWVAGGAGGVAGDEVVTGGSNVVCHGVTLDVDGAAAGGYPAPQTQSNVDGAGGALAGAIGFLVMNNAADEGEWWAIIQK